MARLKHPNISPFYEWLHHDEIRDAVHDAMDMAPGERLVVIKGLIPGLVDALGVEELEDFLDELSLKARRYDEARTHRGEGRRQRRTPGEFIGGATPSGHVHAREPRDPDRPGGRNAERYLERVMWRAAARRRSRTKRLAAPALIGLGAAGVTTALVLMLRGRNGAHSG